MQHEQNLKELGYTCKCQKTLFNDNINSKFLVIEILVLF
uniref:Uncharacterized protein n=1 Tax=Rhizophora mucronata TaxID=61149 RepID=A0A2P2R3S6_RHIMU